MDSFDQQRPDHDAMSNGTSSLWNSTASSYPWRSNDAQPMEHNQMQHRMMRPGSRKPPHAQPCLLGMGFRGPLLLERATWRAPLALTPHSESLARVGGGLGPARRNPPGPVSQKVASRRKIVCGPINPTIRNGDCLLTVPLGFCK